jgi:hypothetical protein
MEAGAAPSVAPLRPALEEVHVPAVGGELDVDRRPELLPEDLEQRAHARHERGLGEEPLEREHDAVLPEVDETHRPAQVVVVGNRDHRPQERHLLAVPLEQLVQVDGLERTRLQVDDVGLLR